MKYLSKKTGAVFLTSMLFLSGCGSSSDDSVTGVFIDDVVSGIKYVNGDKSGFTNEKGEFPYDSGAVEFYLGKIKIGKISSLGEDKKVFVQDIVGVERTNTDDPKVLKIASLLQSIDADKNTDTIEISEDAFNEFENENTVIDDIDVETLLERKGFEKVSNEEVKRHLDNVIKSYGLDENANVEKSDIVVKNIETNLSETESYITITFSEDIKKDNLSDNVKLYNQDENPINFDLTYGFDFIKLNVKEQIQSFENYKLDIMLSNLEAYGAEVSSDDISLVISSDENIDDSSDIVPPLLQIDVKKDENLSSNITKWKLTGSASDRSLKNVVVEVDNKEIKTSLEDGRFSANLDLENGLNNLIYKVIAIDESGNKTSITSSSNVTLGQTVAAGGSHSAALKDGVLYTWGRNNFGQTGLGYISSLSDDSNGKHPVSPVKIETSTKLVSLSFNQNYSLAIDENGDVYSWGYDKYGELGRGSENKDNCSNTEDCRVSIGKIEGLSDVTYISAGYSHALAIKKDNSVWAFGSGTDGELGNGEKNHSSIPLKVNFGGETPVIVQVNAGSDFSVALDDEGQVWAWGKNNYGQMGQGEEFGTEDQVNPIKIPMPNGSKISSLATGKGHVLALAEDGTVYGWGLNFSSQIGYYGYQYKNTENAWAKYIYSPKKILENDEDNPVIQVYAGGNSSYILRKDKKIYPWGQYGETSEDGSQDYNNLDFPEDKLTAITSVKDIAAGALHVAAVKEDNTVFTWRWSFEGSLGGGESTANIWFYLYPIIPEFPND